MEVARRLPIPPSPADVAAKALDAPDVRALIVLDRTLPAEAARYARLAKPLHPQVLRGLERQGVDRLYTHQVEAVELAMSGQSLVVVTPTASGKSLCYLIPVLESIASDPDATSMLLYPTKALAQDQLSQLHRLADAADLAVPSFTYDGDTPAGARAALRRSGRVVLTNPDMLHSGILPQHTAWVRLFRHLRYVVLDELHTYRGVFGSHVSNVIRRLERICRFYGASPTYICCSATIANPQELASRLLGREVSCVENSGAPRPRRRVVVLNPPIVEARLGIRRSASRVAAKIVPDLVRGGSQTVVFGQTRLQVELLLDSLRRELDRPGELSRGARRPEVVGYRGGYLPLERRAIEAGLRQGEVRCVVSTSALELGVDVGSLDAAVLVGYPGTIASTWQRLGRAGRRDRPALQLVITGGGPLDQYLAQHPTFLLERSPERALVDPDNLLILAAHLQAAIFELPLTEDEAFGGGLAPDLLRVLEEDGVIHQSGRAWHWTADAFPADSFGLRTSGGGNVVIVDTTGDGQTSSQGPQGSWAGSSGGHAGSGARVVGEIDEWSAPLWVHDDAVYLHQGRQFHVERLDWEERRAYVHPVSVDYFTDADLRVGLQVLERFTAPMPDEGRLTDRSHGEVRVSVLAAMYRKIRFLTNETVGAGPIRVPERDLHTTAYWCTFPGVGRVGAAQMEVGVAALGHALGQTACWLAMCDRRDIGVVAQVRSRLGPSAALAPSTLTDEFVPGERPPASAESGQVVGDRPTVFIYDCHPGGIGLSARLFDLHETLLRTAAGLIRDCTCAEGCPACVGAVAGVEPEAKSAALELLAGAGW